MYRSRKPIHQCYTCLLNQGDHCWGFWRPSEQWERWRRCPAFENEQIYREFTDWRKQAQVKTRKELRREALRKRKPAPRGYLESRSVRKAG